MVTTRVVEYPADGLTMVGRLAVPDGNDRRPAVLVGLEGPGLNDYQAHRADLLAERGYVALTMDHNGGRWISDPAEMMARLNPLLADPDRMRGIGQAALDVLVAEPRTDPSRLAAVGYGTGGTIAMELGRAGADLKAIFACNPWLATVRPADSANITGQVLVCVGSEDPIVSPEQRRAFQAEMQAAGVDWRLNVYGGAHHAFHHPPAGPEGSPGVPGVAYHDAHARRAWRAMLDMLEEALA